MGSMLELDQGGPWLVLVHGLTVAALLSLFGSLVFARFVAPLGFGPAGALEKAQLSARLDRLAGRSLLAALAGLCMWAPMQAADMVNAASWAQALAALPDVLGLTRFGHIVLLQLGGLLLTALAMQASADRRLACVAAALALALHAGRSHAAAASGGAVLLAAELVHLLAAGVWLGGLWPLWLMVRHGGAEMGARMCRAYSPFGKWAVMAVLLSAGVQFYALIGGVPGLIGTDYGWVAIGKIELFCVLFGFALINRYWLAPSLRGAKAAGQRRLLLGSIGWQTGFALAIVLLAGLLSQLSPAALR